MEWNGKKNDKDDDCDSNSIGVVKMDTADVSPGDVSWYSIGRWFKALLLLLILLRLLFEMVSTAVVVVVVVFVMEDGAWLVVGVDIVVDDDDDDDVSHGNGCMVRSRL